MSYLSPYLVGNDHILWYLFSEKSSGEASIVVCLQLIIREITHSTQDKIVKYVNEIPGIRYRELLRMTGLSNGVLSYHLRLLDNSGRIRINRVNNRVTRYFSYDVSTHESYVIGLLRQETTRKIILYILEKGACGFHDIMIHTKKVPSTISWHLTRLKAANIVKVQ